MKNLLTAIEQANKLAQLFGLQFFAYVSDGEQKENLSSNLVLSDLETVIGKLREWRTGPIPEPTKPSVLVLESKAGPKFMLSEGKPWSNSFGGLDVTTYVQGLPEFFTGRWFIQPINLPCSDPTNQKQ